MAHGTRRDALRADAERNRRALLDAARTVFGEQGIDAPLDEIARRAGVGNATLYRRFPTRTQLVTAVFAERLAAHADALAHAIDDPDPWNAFRGYVLHAFRMQAANRGLADLLTMSTPDEPALEDLRTRAYAGLVGLVRRAQAAGALRADFEPEDLMLLLMANAGLVRRTEHHAPGVWERYASFLLDGLRAPAATPAPASPGEQAVRAAMAAHASSLGCGTAAHS